MTVKNIKASSNKEVGRKHSVLYYFCLYKDTTGITNSIMGARQCGRMVRQPDFLFGVPE